jgi:hypothetical protein
MEIDPRINSNQPQMFQNRLDSDRVRRTMEIPNPGEFSPDQIEEITNLANIVSAQEWTTLFNALSGDLKALVLADGLKLEVTASVVQDYEQEYYKYKYRRESKYDSELGLFIEAVGVIGNNGLALTEITTLETIARSLNSNTNLTQQTHLDILNQNRKSLQDLELASQSNPEQYSSKFVAVCQDLKLKLTQAREEIQSLDQTNRGKEPVLKIKPDFVSKYQVYWLTEIFDSFLGLIDIADSPHATLENALKSHLSIIMLWLLFNVKISNQSLKRKTLQKYTNSLDLDIPAASKLVDQMYYLTRQFIASVPEAIEFWDLDEQEMEIPGSETMKFFINSLSILQEFLSFDDVLSRPYQTEDFEIQLHSLLSSYFELAPLKRRLTKNKIERPKADQYPELLENLIFPLIANQNSQTEIQASTQTTDPAVESPAPVFSAQNKIEENQTKSVSLNQASQPTADKPDKFKQRMYMLLQDLYHDISLNPSVVNTFLSKRFNDKFIIQKFIMIVSYLSSIINAIPVSNMDAPNDFDILVRYINSNGALFNLKRISGHTINMPQYPEILTARLDRNFRIVFAPLADGKVEVVYLGPHY